MITGNRFTTDTSAIVIPFYLYAAFALLVSVCMLFFSAPAFTDHYFHPYTLSITHLMALGWGSMIILGASHQLVPVIADRKLYSAVLARISFYTAAIGIPLLVYGMCTFQMGVISKWGGRLVLTSVLIFAINLITTILKSKQENIYGLFIITATLWFLTTCIIGLALVYNFTYNLMPHDSLHYLPLHAHAGIIGWFLFMITGVGAKLIPMFLISKYENRKLLNLIFYLYNTGLLAFVFLFLFTSSVINWFIPLMLIVAGISLFGIFIYRSYKHRIRRKVDAQLKLAFLSVAGMVISAVLCGVILTIAYLSNIGFFHFALAYGFIIFFGWITLIILGMTFKTLPFIRWNAVYSNNPNLHKAPQPSALFHAGVFRWMYRIYLAGFLVSFIAILFQQVLLLQMASIVMGVAVVAYCFNVIKIVLHKSAVE